MKGPTSSKMRHKLNFMKGPTSLQSGPTYRRRDHFSPDGPSYCCHLAGKSYQPTTLKQVFAPTDLSRYSLSQRLRYVSHETPALRSFIYVDVGEPLFNECRTTTYYNFELLGVTWHIYFAGIAITSRRSTERPEDFFSKSVESHLVLRVSSCGVLVLFLVGFVLFFLEDTWLFAFTYSPICGNS